jgi:hypothetical protein
MSVKASKNQIHVNFILTLVCSCKQKRGIVYSRGGSKRRKQDTDPVVDSSSLGFLESEDFSGKTKPKKQKIENQVPGDSNTDCSPAISPSHGPPGIHHQIIWLPI